MNGFYYYDLRETELIIMNKILIEHFFFLESRLADKNMCKHFPGVQQFNYILLFIFSLRLISTANNNDDETTNEILFASPSIFTSVRHIRIGHIQKIIILYTLISWIVHFVYFIYTNIIYNFDSEWNVAYSIQFIHTWKVIYIFAFMCLYSKWQRPAHMCYVPPNGGK